MAQGVAVCAHCAANGRPAMVKGEVVTPAGTSTVDFKKGDFQKVLDAIAFHRRVDGRPVIEHKCPIQGHTVYLYTDIEEVPA